MHGLQHARKAVCRVRVKGKTYSTQPNGNGNGVAGSPFTPGLNENRAPEYGSLVTCSALRPYLAVVINNVSRPVPPNATLVTCDAGISTAVKRSPVGAKRVTRLPPQCAHQRQPSASTVSPSGSPSSV